MSDDQRRSRPSTTENQDGPIRVTVLGAFTLTAAGSTVPLGVDARRLVAYLAVHPRPQDRAALAADLWPNVSGERLLGEAVAAVAVPGLLADGPDGTLALAADVEVDLAEAMRLVRALPEIPAGQDTDTTLLTAGDILPGWTASWIAVERERFRQLRLYAIEERSQRLTAAGRHDAAVAMAELAARSAPSRESARRVLIQAHQRGRSGPVRARRSAAADAGLAGAVGALPDAALRGTAARVAFGARVRGDPAPGGRRLHPRHLTLTATGRELSSCAGVPRRSARYPRSRPRSAYRGTAGR